MQKAFQDVKSDTFKINADRQCRRSTTYTTTSTIPKMNLDERYFGNRTIISIPFIL